MEEKRITSEQNLVCLKKTDRGKTIQEGLT